MPVVVQGFPDLPSHTQTVSLGGVKVSVMLYWRPRLNGWYMDLLSADKTVRHISGRRLSPGTSPNMDRIIEGGPGGYLFVSGTDGYTQEALGADLLLKFFTTAEVEAAVAASATDDGLTVELAP